MEDLGLDEPLLDADDGDKRAKKVLPPDDEHDDRSRISASGRVVKKHRGTQSSFTTILSIWNTMLGSSLVAMPWAISQAGLHGGLLTILVMMFACLYTCALVVKHGAGMTEFFTLVSVYVGPMGKFWCWLASVAVLMGVLCAYTAIAASCLFNIVGKEESTFWNQQIVSIYFVAVLFPCLNFKSTEIFVRLNSFGALSVIALVLFMIYSSIFGPDQPSISITDVPDYKFRPNWFKFAGVLALSFFIHNVILPIMKNNKYPEHNLRDLTIAYVLVALSFCACAVSGFLGYGAGELEQDYLKMFPASYVPATIARVFVFFQLSTLFPLILVVCRGQFLSYLCEDEYPSFRIAFAVTVLLALMSAGVPVMQIAVGDIMRYVGCITGLIIVFILPVLVHLNATFPKDPTKGVSNELLDTDVSGMSPEVEESPAEGGLLDTLDHTDLETSVRTAKGQQTMSEPLLERGRKQSDRALDRSYTAGAKALLAAKTSAGPDAILQLGPTGYVVQVYERWTFRFWASVLFHSLFLVFACAIVLGNFAADAGKKSEG